MLLADITQGGVTFDPVPAFVFAGALCAVFLGWGIGIWWMTYGPRARRRAARQPLTGQQTAARTAQPGYAEQQLQAPSATQPSPPQPLPADQPYPMRGTP